MGQDVTEDQVFEAIKLYKERYGSTANLTPRKWDDIVTEVKYGNKGDTNKQTPRQARQNS